MRCTVARSRRLVGLLCLLALGAIAIGVAGFELPFARSSGGTASTGGALPGVRAAASTVLLRVGKGAPPGGDLAFLAIEPSGNLVVTDRTIDTHVRRIRKKFEALGADPIETVHGVGYRITPCR